MTTTTTSVDSEGPVNPWSLPLEERPPLFDPCDIPIGVIEEGVGQLVEYDDELREYQKNSLAFCAWKTEEIIISSLSTWKSKNEYLNDRTFEIVGERESAGGRSSLRLVEERIDPTLSCFDLYFTGRGTVWISVNLLDYLNEFRGKRYSNACEVLDEVTGPILSVMPEGEF